MDKDPKDAKKDESKDPKKDAKDPKKDSSPARETASSASTTGRTTAAPLPAPRVTDAGDPNQPPAPEGPPRVSPPPAGSGPFKIPDALLPFYDLLREGVSAEKIAQISGVPLEEVQRVVDLEAIRPEPPEPISGPMTPAQIEQREHALEQREARLERREAKAKREDAAEGAPATVRAVRKANIRDAAGRSWRIGRRDIYSGEKAAFLWQHHRELVEVYVPPPSSV